MEPLTPVVVQCPHCWEQFETLVDCSVASQEYVEDCQVCCQPMVFEVEVQGEGPVVTVRGENA